jgi:hypothetical protein
MKKVVCLIMSLLVLVFTLSGCGGSNKLAGTSWSIASGQNTSNLICPSHFYFSKDGVVTITSDEDFFQKASCTYSAEDGILTIEGYHGSTYSFEYTITGSTMVLITDGKWGFDKIEYLRN